MLKHLDIITIINYIKNVKYILHLEDFMKKVDEMEMAINYHAMKCSFIFLDVSLLTYCFITLATTGELPSIPFIFVCAGNAVFFLMKLYLTRQMTKDNDDDEE